MRQETATGSHKPHNFKQKAIERPNQMTKISNTTFLQAIFQGLEDGTRPVHISSSDGNLNKLPYAWSGDNAPEDPRYSNYFSLCAFHPDSSGVYKRQKEYTDALYCIVLDDILLQADNSPRKDKPTVTLASLPLEPSWVLETSSNNLQVGFILSSPCKDIGTANILIKELGKAGYCDKGVSPPQGVLDSLLGCADKNGLPTLKGFSDQPTLQKDLTLSNTHGYDPATEFFNQFHGKDFNIPQHPTRDDALASLKALERVLEEFPFASDADLSATLTGMLTAVLRPSLPSAPLIHVKAAQAGSGKSYLCALLAKLATKAPAETVHTFLEKAFKNRSFSTKDITKNPDLAPLLGDILNDVCLDGSGALDAVKLGRYLAHQENVDMEDRRIVYDGMKNGSKRWRVDKTKNATFVDIL